MGICRIQGMNCDRPAFDKDDEGLCLLHSRRADKDRDGAFKRAVKEQMARQDYNFRLVFFPGHISFEGHEFGKNADFFFATFNGHAVFNNATFSGNAIFTRATFSSFAFFFRATFTKEALFISATFNEQTIFSRAIFKGHALFKDATFVGDAFFEQTIFIGEAFFEEATIGSRVVLRNLNPQEDAESIPPPFHCHFKHLKFQSQGRLRFQDLSLAKCEFAGTDLRRPELHHVAWQLLWGGRQAIYDEVLLRHKELSLVKRLLNFIGLMNATGAPTTDDYGRVERLYRNLKLNYITEGDNKNAGDFHYGELEMHRRASKWRWFPFYWNNLFRVLSGYGEQPLRALGWLFIFLVGMAGLVWELGLEVGNPPHLAGFGDSFIYILQKVTLQRPTWAEPVGFWGKLVAGLSVLLIPGQAALFLLALRNRLGRRR